MPESTQDLKNHAKFDPPFHFFLVPVGLLLLAGTVYQLVQTPTLTNGGRVLAMIWIIVAIFKTRLYALKVQDRVIRLEERLRIEKLCGDSLKARAGELTIDQLIGLRFAGDVEFPRLVEEALSKNWTRKQVKANVKDWRSDHWRV